MRIDRRIRIATVVVALVGIVRVPAAGGHGAVIRLGTQSIAAGDSLSVVGEEFRVGAEIRLVLEGAAGRTLLSTLSADGEGRFQTAVVIPLRTSPGGYRVVAEAGEDRATSDLLVTAAAGEGMAGGHDETPAARATAEELPLNREHQAAEGILGWALVGALIALGVWLARGARTSRQGPLM